MKRLNNSGSHVVAFFVAFLVLGVIGLAGYKVYKGDNVTVSTPTLTKTASAVPGTIKSNADLTQAAKALDASSAQVNSSLNDGSLNNDLNDLL